MKWQVVLVVLMAQMAPAAANRQPRRVLTARAKDRFQRWTQSRRIYLQNIPNRDYSVYFHDVGHYIEQLTQQNDRAVAKLAGLSHTPQFMKQKPGADLERIAELRTARERGFVSVITHGEKMTYLDRDLVLAEAAVQKQHGLELPAGQHVLKVLGHLLRPTIAARRFRRYEPEPLSRLVKETAAVVGDQLIENPPGVRTALTDAETSAFRQWATDLDIGVLDAHSMPAIEQQIPGPDKEPLGYWAPPRELLKYAEPGSQEHEKLVRLQEAGFLFVFVYSGKPSVFQRDWAKATFSSLRRYLRRNPEHGLTTELERYAHVQALESIFALHSEPGSMKQYGPAEVTAALKLVASDVLLAWRAGVAPK